MESFETSWKSVKWFLPSPPGQRAEYWLHDRDWDCAVMHRIVKHFTCKKFSQITEKANHIASISTVLIEKCPSVPKLPILLQASRSMWLQTVLCKNQGPTTDFLYNLGNSLFNLRLPQLPIFKGRTTILWLSCLCSFLWYRLSLADSTALSTVELWPNRVSLGTSAISVAYTCPCHDRVHALSQIARIWIFRGP